MPVRVQTRARVFVIAASGDLDLVSRPLIDAAVNSALAGKWRLIVVDVGQLRFVDVAGAGPLQHLVGALPADRMCLIVNADPNVQRTLQFLGLGSWVVPVEQLPLATDTELAQLLAGSS